MTPVPGNVSLVELGRLKAAALVWQPQQAAPVLTVICKATFELTPGVAGLASVQDDVNLRDLHTENNPRLGLYSASDVVPYKPRADVTVVGKAFAPPNQLARSVIARVKVGSVDKRVEVHADRYLNRHGRLRANAFFSKMPIGYERSAGGPDTPNPVGRALDGSRDDKGRLALPNVQVPGETVSGPSGWLTPVGLGPIPASWPWRRALLRGEAPWSGDRWLDPALPADWNFAFFNVAPPDQQLDEIRLDEAIHLEHLHPDEPRLETRLSGVRPCVFVQRGQAAQAVTLRADTLWIDTNRLVQTLTWRGQLSLEEPVEMVRVLVAAVEPGAADPSWDQVWWMAEQKRSSPPPSSGSERVKTRAEGKAGNKPVPSSQRLTSPVPLVPSSDHSPGWLPPPSRRAPPRRDDGGPESPPAATVIDGEGRSVEVMLSPSEREMLDELAADQALSPGDVLRHLLRQAYARRRSC
jgi:hypothetical protein